ncbi:hypothetical protein J6590_052114 [Homalodisca vitripennis]|nr:hypothetical protein J6590_052114 [Homalodisca vitripennis]
MLPTKRCCIGSSVNERSSASQKLPGQGFRRVVGGALDTHWRTCSWQYYLEFWCSCMTTPIDSLRPEGTGNDDAEGRSADMILRSRWLWRMAADRFLHYCTRGSGPIVFHQSPSGKSQQAFISNWLSGSEAYYWRG